MDNNKHWMPDTDDESVLPPIDKEVVALEKVGDIGYRVCFAHRVDTSYAIGYGKANWNLENIAYWVDIPLPEELYKE